MKSGKRPFDFRKFFTLLGLMGGMLLFTAFMLGLLASLYDWFGLWGVAGLELVLLVLSSILVRRFGPRVLSQLPNSEMPADAMDVQHDREVS